VNIVSQLQPLHSTGVYHTSLKEPGCQPVPANAIFKIDSAATKPMPRGLLLGNFGKNDKPTHLVVVNLDYKTGITATITGPGKLELFDATTGKWTTTNTDHANLQLQPGGGQLIRVAQ